MITTSVLERAALQRSILENPAEDTVRLVFADWLDEHGESERATYIRSAIRGEPEDELLRCHGGGWLCPWVDSLGVPTYKTGVDMYVVHGWGGVTTPECHIVLMWQRGFIHRVELTRSGFLRYAASIFAEHPITEVDIVGAPLAQTVDGWVWLRDEIDPEVFDHLRVSPGDSEPAELCGGYPIRGGRIGSMISGLLYLTPDRARTALSRACVSLGRLRAGLSQAPTG